MLCVLAAVPAQPQPTRVPQPLDALQSVSSPSQILEEPALTVDSSKTTEVRLGGATKTIVSVLEIVRHSHFDHELNYCKSGSMNCSYTVLTVMYVIRSADDECQYHDST